MLNQADFFSYFNTEVLPNIQDSEKCLDFIKKNLTLHDIARFLDHLSACWYAFELLKAVPSDEQRVEVVNVCNEDGENALFAAVRAGNLELVKLLHQTGADINGRKNHEGETTLVVAGRDGNTEVVEYLIQNAVLPNIQVQDSKKCLDFIKENLPLHEIASFPDHRLACWCAYELLEAIPSKEQKRKVVNICNEDGENALFAAVRAGNLDLVVLLCENGADINGQKDHEQETTLVVACRDGNTTMVAYLLQQGAKQEVIDSQGNLLAGVATEYEHSNILEFFSNSYPDLIENVYDPGFHSFHPIHRAVEILNIPLVDFWLRQGIDINFTNKHNMTPLDLAYQIVCDRSRPRDEDTVTAWAMLKHLIKKRGKLNNAFHRQYMDGPDGMVEFTKKIADGSLNVFFFPKKFPLFSVNKNS